MAFMRLNWLLWVFILRTRPIFTRNWSKRWQLYSGDLEASYKNSRNYQMVTAESNFLTRFEGGRRLRFFFVRWFAIRFFVSPRHELSRQKSYFRFLPCAGKKLNSANNSFLLQVRLQLYFFLSMNFHCFSSQSPQDFRRVNRGWRFLKWNCFLKPVTWWNWIDLLNNLLNFFFVSFVYPQCTWKRPWTQTIRVSSKCWNAKQPFWPNGSPPVNRASSWPPASSVASHLEKK